MKILIKGYTTLTGSPLSIIRMVRDAQFFQESIPEDLGEWMDQIQAVISVTFGTEITAVGTTIEERAEDLIRKMAAHEIIEIVEED